jgi:hypothetical protein
MSFNFDVNTSTLKQGIGQRLFGHPSNQEEKFIPDSLTLISLGRASGLALG